MEAILARCRKHPYYAVARKYAYPARKCLHLWRSCIYSDFISSLRKKSGKLPKWLIDVFPEIGKLRQPLGEQAYDHLISIAYTSHSYRNAMRDMAIFLWNAGLQDDGIALHAALLNDYGPPETSPEAQIVSYLQMLMFGSPEIQTNEHIYKEHVRWSRHFISGKTYKTYPNSLAPGRRLKIGYTCHFITSSTSKTLLQPFLKGHHRERVEVFMYSDEPPETMTDPVRGLAEHWRDTYGMDTDAFCELLRKDEIDILLELNGHGVHQRYHAITRHPAPVQVAYYNYACTTGVSGMDYVLSSDDINIDHLQPFYSEKIFRKKACLHAMTVGDHFPPVSNAAFEKNGYITFCSFGQAHKVTRENILLWCEVLRKVPGSRFFMKAQALGGPANRAAFIHHFKDGGIDESRLILEGNSGYATLLSCYERVDIGLDTYPCNGGTTTTEALIQGVPVVTLAGDRYSSMMGKATMAGANHPELTARTRVEFVDKAVALANDKMRIQLYRRNLRNDFSNARRCDLDGFMHELEDSYEEMWRRFLVEYEKQQ